MRLIGQLARRSFFGIAATAATLTSPVTHANVPATQVSSDPSTGTRAFQAGGLTCGAARAFRSIDGGGKPAVVR